MLSYTVACSLFAVTINTELLTTDEYETIVSIYNEAKQRHAVRTQQSSGSEQKLVRPVAKNFVLSGRYAISSVVFQDRILDSLTNMQERISTLEAKGTTGPVLSQQPMQLHGQYGYTPPHQQLPYFQPPVSQYGTGQVTHMAPPQHMFGAAANKFKTPSGVKPSASFTLGQVSGISDRSRYDYNSIFSLSGRPVCCKHFGC